MTSNVLGLAGVICALVCIAGLAGPLWAVGAAAVPLLAASYATSRSTPAARKRPK